MSGVATPSLISPRRSLEAMLQANGHGVVLPKSAREGLEELGCSKLDNDAGNKMDIMLMDLAMPMMNGDRFSRVGEIMHPGIPTVMLTGLAEMLHTSEFLARSIR